MKNTIAINLAAGIIIFGLFVSPPVRGENAAQDVVNIMNQTKEIFEPTRPCMRKIVISTSEHGEKGQDLIAGQVVKQFPDGKCMLMVILEPEDVKGTAFLIQERENKPTVMMIYLPSIRRIRKLGPVEQYDSFLGTDFTYGDLDFIKLKKGYKLLGTEEHAAVRAYKVEEDVPQERSFYSRIITWIATDSLLPLQRNYYSTNGELWKTELFEEVSVIDGVPTPLRIKMKDIGDGTSTELALLEVDYDADIPDEIFSQKELLHVAAHPLWQVYGSRSVEKK
jgi:hypothetical protein